MPKKLEITADLRLQHETGEVKVHNDSDGNLIVSFPDNSTFNAFLNTKLPVKPELKAIRKANATLYEQRQPLIVKVNEEEWVVLGRSENPIIRYAKVTVPYFTRNFPWKTSLYTLGGVLGASLLYWFVRKRN